MSRPHAQVDLQHPFLSEGHGSDNLEEHEEEDMGSNDDDAHLGYDVTGFVGDDGGEEIDLEGYEQYLAELKSKAKVRPHSARTLRTIPSESPQFYMVNADNPRFPAAATAIGPTRPSSARLRTNSSGGARYMHDSSQTPRMNQQMSASRASLGVRRKRNGGENAVHARVRAIYHDTGRTAPPVRQIPSSVSASSTIANKLNVFQQAELHDEYYKLVDVVTELKSACQQEQERRVKAMARIRRLEEIVALKDRKIESLLHAKSVGSDHSHLVGAITQREMAQRDRQNNAMLLKLRHKIVQQSQIISSYEDAMQSLRTGIKSTNLMELEEEQNQLYIEVRHQQEEIACQRIEIESQNKHIAELMQIEAGHRQQIGKLQQENKRCLLEKQKMDQEIAFFKVRADQLQEKLVLEQRKRTYDREVSSTVTANGGSPLHTSVLASALEEMKALMKQEYATSIQREKLKSPRSTSKPSPRSVTLATASSSAPTASSSTATSALPPPRHARSQSTGPTRPHRSIVSPPVSTNSVAKSINMLSNSDLPATSLKPTTPPPPEDVEIHQNAAGRDRAESPSLSSLGLMKHGATLAERAITPVESHTDEGDHRESAEVTSGMQRTEKETFATEFSDNHAGERNCNEYSGTEEGECLAAQIVPAGEVVTVVQSNEAIPDERSPVTAKEEEVDELVEAEKSLLRNEDESVGPSDATEFCSQEDLHPLEPSPSLFSHSSSRAFDAPWQQTSSTEDGDRAQSEETLDLDAKGAAMALELRDLGLLKNNSQDSVLHSTPGDAMYDSDFTENENEAEHDEEGENDSSGSALGLQ